MKWFTFARPKAKPSFTLPRHQHRWRRVFGGLMTRFICTRCRAFHA